MQSSIQFNEMGVIYYEKGNMDLAIYAFTEALKQICHWQSSPSSADDRASISASNPSASQEEDDDTSPMFEENENVSAASQQDSAVDLGDADSMIIRKAGFEVDGVFVFGEVFPLSRFTHDLTVAECGLRCMFNLALANHQLAYERNSPSHTEKAEKIYGLAYSLLLSEEVKRGPLMLAAIVNNLGHLHQMMGQTERSQQCYEHLLMALMFVTVGSDIRLDEGLHERFFTNVMNMVLRDSRLAAAA